MRIKLKHPADYLTLGIVLWIFLYILLNLLPQSWFLDYKELHVSDVCRDEQQILTGTRDVPFRLGAGGVDQLWSYDKNRFVYRIEWSGAYQAGETTTSWKETISEPEGVYYWEATTLNLDLPLFLKVDINGVRSNDFIVKDCESNSI